MRLSCLLLLACLAVQSAFSDETNLTLTVDRVVYSNVTFGAATPATVKVFHSTGVASLPLAKLSPELQKRFGYDAAKAAEYTELEQKAETARLAALKAKWAAESERLAKEEAAQREEPKPPATAETKNPVNAVVAIRFVSFPNIAEAGQGVYMANLIGVDNGSSLAQFDESGKRFLEAAQVKLARWTERERTKKKQTEDMAKPGTATLITQDGPVNVLTPGEDLRFSSTPPPVFTVYAVKVDATANSVSFYRLIGSQEVMQMGGTTGYSW